MAFVTISNLPPAPALTGSGSPQGTDLIPATDITDPTESSSGTTKKYTRAEELNFALAALGAITYQAVLVTTTGALTAVYDNGTLGVNASLTNSGVQAALVLDGVTVPLSARVLVQDQASTFENGIYTVLTTGSDSTNWVLRRATDYDTAAEIVQYGTVLVNQGTQYAGRLFEESSPGPFVIGTSPITFDIFHMQSITLPLLLSQGGTSAVLTANDGGIFYSNATTGAILAGTAVATRMLQSGLSSAPAWSTTTWPATSTINQLLYSSAANTVTGLVTGNNGLLVTGATGIPAILAGPGVAGKVLQSNTALAPSFSTATYPSVATGAGTILRADGTNWLASTATFADTYAISTLLYASSSNVVTGLATAINSTLTTDGSGVPSWTATATGTGITWSTVAGITQAAAVNSGYVIGNVAQTTVTLPDTADVGKIVYVQGLGAGGWVLTANTGQTIHIGSSVTSSGGTVTSGDQWDAIGVVCVVECTPGSGQWSMLPPVSSALGGYTLA
jgi:hypothetical protein